MRTDAVCPEPEGRASKQGLTCDQVCQVGQYGTASIYVPSVEELTMLAVLV